MFRKMVATAALVASLMTVGGPALASPIPDDLADPRPSPELSFSDVELGLADPRPSPIFIK